MRRIDGEHKDRPAARHPQELIQGLRERLREGEGDDTDGAEAVDAKPVAAPEGRLSVSGLTCMYPGDETPVLQSVAFDLDPGESLGVIGPAGSGKSTPWRRISRGFFPSRTKTSLPRRESPAPTT